MRELPLPAVSRFDRTSVVFQIAWGLGDFIRKLREDRDWTQQDLADAANLHKTAVVRLERESDKSERATIERAAKALGVALSDLYAHVEQANVFSNLSEGERRHVLEYERRLLAKRTALSPAQDATQPADPPAGVRESRGQVQTRRRK